VWQAVGRQLALTEAQTKELQRDFWASEELDEPLVRYLQGLRPQCKTAILSNAWSNARESFTQTFHLDEAVDMFIISSEERLAKPDARIYVLAAQRLGVKPEEAVLVDDFIANIDGARAAGMQAIHYRPGLDVRAELAKLGVSV